MTTLDPSTTEEAIYEFNLLQQPAFEGAATSYRQDLRGLLTGDADTLAAREVNYLIMRSNHAFRNNGYAKAAVNKYVTALQSLKVVWQTPQKKEHKLMQSYWDEFISNPNNDNYGTFDNTQSLWNYTFFQTGNVYTRFLIKTKNNDNSIPLKLQVIPTEMRDLLYNGLTREENIKYGMKFENDVPISYFFRKGLYNQYWFNINSGAKPVEVPASEIAHMFIREHPGQWIGIPKLAPILLPLYELDELTDATIAKQKAAQVISWIVKNTNPSLRTPVGVPESVKAQPTIDNPEPTTKIRFKSSGGNVQYLNKGEEVQFYQSTDIGANLPTLIKSELQRIASALDIPYHTLTGDTSGLDFSSIRAIGIELRNRIEYIHHFYTIPLGISKVTSTFLNLAKLYNRKLGNAIPTYQLPRFYGVDELKDNQADLLEIRSGMSTLQKKLDERHTTFEEVLEDAKKNQALIEAGIDVYGDKGNLTSQINNTQANPNSSSN